MKVKFRGLGYSGGVMKVKFRGLGYSDSDGDRAKIEIEVKDDQDNSIEVGCWFPADRAEIVKEAFAAAIDGALADVERDKQHGVTKPCVMELTL